MAVEESANTVGIHILARAFDTNTHRQRRGVQIGDWERIAVMVCLNSDFTNITSGRRQSKTLLTIDECGSKLARNCVFDCHLSPIGRQMAIENSVSNDFIYVRR